MVRKALDLNRMRILYTEIILGCCLSLTNADLQSKRNFAKGKTFVFVPADDDVMWGEACVEVKVHRYSATTL